MPRHLQRCLHVLASWDARPDEYSAAPTSYERREQQAAAYYMAATGLWHHLGFELVLADEVRSLWSGRPDLRPLLWHLLSTYPCDRFARPFRAYVQTPSGFRHADWSAWLEAFPSLRHELLPRVESVSRRFNDPDSIYACLLWARHFGGGDDAYRAIALAMKRDERRYKRQTEAFNQGSRAFPASDSVRHDLEDHGVLSQEEASVINTHLDQLKASSLDVIPRGHRWQMEDPDAWKEEARRGRWLAAVARHSFDFARSDWGSEDVQQFALRLGSLSDEARASFRADGHPALEQILHHAYARSQTVGS